MRAATSSRRSRRFSLSWEYDLKNDPVKPIVDDGGVVSFGTRPCPHDRSVRGATTERHNWRHSSRRVLKTARDYADMDEWIALRPTRQALRTNSRGAVPHLARAMVAKVLKLPWHKRPTYPDLAQHLARDTGLSSSPRHTIDNIRRKRDEILDEGVSMLSDACIEFARSFRGSRPSRELLRSVIAPGSRAERQFPTSGRNAWLRRLCDWSGSARMMRRR